MAACKLRAAQHAPDQCAWVVNAGRLRAQHARGSVTSNGLAWRSLFMLRVASALPATTLMFNQPLEQPPLQSFNMRSIMHLKRQNLAT